MIKKFNKEIIVIAILIAIIWAFKGAEVKIYKIFYNFNNLSENINYKNFFINITEVGDSVWFFLLFIVGFTFFYFLKKLSSNNQVKINNHTEFQNFFLFSFVGLIITGIITQIIKHIVGRPRPNYSMESGFYEFDLINFNSYFHSFPSGHASTIFLVAFVFSLLTPKIRYIYFIFASIIAISRVVVGAHYFTDLLGGFIVAIIGFKITKYIFEKINKSYTPKLLGSLASNLYFLTLLVFFIFAIFLSIGPSLDIYISELFYKDQNFKLQSLDIITILTRKYFLYFLIFYILIIPIICIYFPINKLYAGSKFTLKKVLFIFFSFLANLILVVNLLLKNLWGRARPNDINELGGGDLFTPWYAISKACDTNCSFVSGDASVGFSLIIFYLVTKNKIFYWLALFSGFFIGLIRIMEGGHFLSDVFLSGFLIFLLYLIEFYLFKKFISNDL